jgi:hypothetical protein
MNWDISKLTCERLSTTKINPSFYFEDMSPSAIETLVTTPSLDRYFENSKSSYIELNGVNTPKQLIGNALKERVQNIDHDVCEPGDEDTFFVADLGEVYRQHMRWKLNLPRVKPFYGKIVTSISKCLMLRLYSGQVQP